jgi:hypothetical protein
VEQAYIGLHPFQRPAQTGGAAIFGQQGGGRNSGTSSSGTRMLDIEISLSKLGYHRRQARPRHHVKRIRIRNYKSLDGVDIALQPLSVLFGPNAAGKSNFIDALQLLSRIAASRTLKEAFEPPYRGKPIESFSFAAGGIGLLKNDSISLSIEVDLNLSPVVIAAVNKEISETKRPHATGGNGAGAKQVSFIHHDQLRYRIEIEISPRTGQLHLADEYVGPLGRDGQPKSRPQPFVERVKDRIHLRMEGQSHPTCFERYLDHAIISRPHYAPHYPHLTALKKELQSWFFITSSHASECAPRPASRRSAI